MSILVTILLLLTTKIFKRIFIISILLHLIIFIIIEQLPVLVVW
jgi:hypothetical protein